MKILEVPLPKPETQQVLVKVEASPVNPSDIAFLRGGYNIVKPMPAIPGFEGCAKIVAVGDEVNSSLIGDRIAFFIQGNDSGAWSEYAVVGVNDFVKVDENIPIDQAACLFVNPLTAYALFEHVRENQHNAIIQTAAYGQVGKFIRFFAKEHNVNVINLVRKPEHIEQLKAEGSSFVLNINDTDFDVKLKKLTYQIYATIAIDAVGGELTGQLLHTIPSGSEVVLYGGLSGMLVSAIDPMDLIFKNKVL